MYCIVGRVREFTKRGNSKLNHVGKRPCWFDTRVSRHGGNNGRRNKQGEYGFIKLHTTDKEYRTTAVWCFATDNDPFWF